MRYLLLLILSACGAAAVHPEPSRTEAPSSPSDGTAPAAPPETEPSGVGFQPLTADVRRVLKDETSWTALELNSQTVFCSAQGYSASVLKVSIPDLDWLAHLDHRVEEIGLPCAAAGLCTQNFGPDALLQGNPGVAVAAVRVILTEHLVIDSAARTCTRQLSEEVVALVRNVTLRHKASGPIEATSHEVCEALAQL